MKYFNKRYAGLLIAGWMMFCLFPTHGYSQEKTKDEKVYSVNKKWEIPVTLALFGTNFLGLNYVGTQPGLDSLEIVALDVNDLWAINRKAVEQDAGYVGQAQHISDWALNVSVALPALLGLDKEIRKDWIDLLVLYGETHAVNGNIYVAAASLNDKARPLVYNPDIPFTDRSESGTLNSFFSGHVSTAAASTFFAAKVYSDYHPEIGNKKYLLFGAALIPPMVVGIYRYKAMKHFPTDVFTGLVVGAGMGVLVPHLHKRKNKMGGFSFVPFSGKYTGCVIGYRF